MRVKLALYLFYMNDEKLCLSNFQSRKKKQCLIYLEYSEYLWLFCVFLHTGAKENCNWCRRNVCKVIVNNLNETYMGSTCIIWKIRIHSDAKTKPHERTSYVWLMLVLLDYEKPEEKIWEDKRVEKKVAKRAEIWFSNDCLWPSTFHKASIVTTNSLNAHRSHPTFSLIKVSFIRGSTCVFQEAEYNFISPVKLQCSGRPILQTVILSL